MFVYSLPVLIAVAVITLLVGAGAGLLLGRRSGGDARRLRDAERKLDQVMQEKRGYEAEVVEHFSQTARLLNSLTDSYREVHNHLSQGAERLCQDHAPVSLGRLQSQDDDAEIPPHLANIQPPLDYAPKSSPEDKGILAEEYGIERPAAESPLREHRDT